jgi:hypothetical protein
VVERPAERGWTDVAEHKADDTVTAAARSAETKSEMEGAAEGEVRRARGSALAAMLPQA